MQSTCHSPFHTHTHKHARFFSPAYSLGCNLQSISRLTTLILRNVLTTFTTERIMLQKMLLDAQPLPTTAVNAQSVQQSSVNQYYATDSMSKLCAVSGILGCQPFVNKDSASSLVSQGSCSSSFAFNQSASLGPCRIISPVALRESIPPL